VNPEAEELSQKIIDDVIKLARISMTFAAGTLVAADLLVRRVIIEHISIKMETKTDKPEAE
jgi:hypothetical protein